MAVVCFWFVSVCTLITDLGNVCISKKIKLLFLAVPVLKNFPKINFPIVMSILTVLNPVTMVSVTQIMYWKIKNEYNAHLYPHEQYEFFRIPTMLYWSLKGKSMRNLSISSKTNYRIWRVMLTRLEREQCLPMFYWTDKGLSWVCKYNIRATFNITNLTIF